MGLDACMRIDAHWDIVKMVSGGGSHVAIVRPRRPRHQTDMVRLLFITPKRPWRWRLSAEMPMATATAIMGKGRETMHKGVGCLHALRTALSYSRTVMPERFRAHRADTDARRLRKNPLFGMF